MVRKKVIGVHPETELKGFNKTESEIVNRVLGKEWLITNCGHITVRKSDYRFVIAKPTKHYSDLFHLYREFIVLFSPYPEFQPRTLLVFNRIMERFDGLRIDKTCSIVISKSKRIESELSEILAHDPEVQIIVPFEYRELSREVNPNLITERFKRYFFQRDLFAFQAELKTDRYFFGRNQTVQRLSTKHKSNENSGLFGLRKSGKTSILHGVRRFVQKEGTLSVIINCQSPAVNLKRWNICLFQIIHEIKAQNHIVQKVREESFYTPEKCCESFEKDLNKLLKKSGCKSILLIFDEIEHISVKVSHVDHWNNGNDFISFWQCLRSIFQKESNILTFLIAGTNPTCVEIPSINGTDNPIFQLVPKDSFITGFEIKDIEQMLDHLGGVMGLKFDPLIFAKLKEDFGGHPFIIRQVCSKIHKNVDTPRPCKVDKTMYLKAKDEYIKENFAYNKMILGVLQEFYPDEFDMLKYLAMNDLESFKSFANIGPEMTNHLLGYGIIGENNGSFFFNIDSLKEYLSDLMKYEKINMSYKEKLSEISERRNEIEPAIRKLIKNVFKINLGEKKAKKLVLNTMGLPWEQKYHLHTYNELFDPKKVEIYWLNLKDLISKNWKLFEHIYGPNKSDFERDMDLINKYRSDAHAKEMTEEDMILFRASMQRVEDNTNDFL